jgi:hypothetical protein
VECQTYISYLKQLSYFIGVLTFVDVTDAVIFRWTCIIYFDFHFSSSIALQTFVGPWPLLQFLDLYTVGRTPWTGDQPVARPLPTHRTTQTQTSMLWVGFEHTIPAIERENAVHAWDRAATAIGLLRFCWLSLCLTKALRHEGVWEWMYRATFSWPRRYLEVNGQLHDPAALSPGKEPPVPIG